MSTPYNGIRVTHTPMRWTGEKPDQGYVAYLAKCCRAARDNPGYKHELRMAQVLYEDITGWAQTRYQLEREFMAYSANRGFRRRRLAILLASVPAWGFEPTPTGWTSDGFAPGFA